MSQGGGSVLAVWAVLSGVGFGCLGVAYRLGQARGVTPTQIGLVIAAAGCAVFGGTVGSEEWAAPAVVWVLGIGVGISQYLVLKLIRPALARGSLSALWCAVNLGFIIAVAYAALFLGERPGLLQQAGIAAAVACVAVASAGQQPAEGGLRSSQCRTADRLAYGLLLLLILVLTGLSPAFLKYLSAHPAVALEGPRVLPVGAGGADGQAALGGSLMREFGHFYYLIFYAVFAVLILADLAITGAIKARMGTAARVGLLGAAGSVVGMWAWAAASPLPAAVLFTVSSVVSLLLAAAVSVTAFGEKRSLAWYATVGLAVAAVVLVSARGLGR